MNRFLQKFTGRTTQEDPLSAFLFSVEIDQFARYGFASVSSPNMETDEMKYREGLNNTTETKSPGLTHFGDITLTRGVIIAPNFGDQDIIKWHKQIFDVSSLNGSATVKIRRTVEIVQYDRERTEVRRWQVVQAWPKATMPFSEMKALESSQIIETMTLCHEGWKLIALTPPSNPLQQP